jgi:hypothetical protein
VAEDKKKSKKTAAVGHEKHDGAMSDPTVAATLKSWTTMTNKNGGKGRTLKGAAEKTTSK